jgi:hypothetical protein
VHPGCCRDAQAVDELQHCRGEAVPLEVGLVAGQQQERLLELVLHEVHGKLRGAVLADVVLVEIDGGAAGAVVEQFVVVEGDNHLVLQRVEEVLAQLGDGGTRIRKPGQGGKQGQAAGHLRDVHRELVQAGRITHDPTLIPRHRRNRAMEGAGVKPRANTLGTLAG